MKDFFSQTKAELEECLVRLKGLQDKPVECHFRYGSVWGKLRACTDAGMFYLSGEHNIHFHANNVSQIEQDGECPTRIFLV